MCSHNCRTSLPNLIEVDDKAGSKRQKLNEFMLDYFIEKYGLAKLAKALDPQT